MKAMLKGTGERNWKYAVSRYSHSLRVINLSVSGLNIPIKRDFRGDLTEKQHPTLCCQQENQT